MNKAACIDLPCQLISPSLSLSLHPLSSLELLNADGDLLHAKEMLSLLLDNAELEGPVI